MRRIILSISCALFLLQQGICQGGNINESQLHGFWLGVMEVTEQMSLQLAFEIEPDSAGNLSAKMNVIEQKAFDIPMSSCLLEGDSLHIRFDQAGISYDGIYIKGQEISREHMHREEGNLNLICPGLMNYPLWSTGPRPR